MTSVKESVRRGNAVGFLTMVMSFADMLALMKRVGRGKEVDRFGLVGGRGGMYPERKENRVRRRPCKGSRMGLEVEETADRQEGVGAKGKGQPERERAKVGYEH